MSRDRSASADPVQREPPRVQETVALKLALTGLAGTSIEWYDFFLYATAAAPVFPTLFFSATLPPLVALIASFSTFAVGFLARPVGAVLFGHLRDRVGRKTTLAVTMIGGGLAPIIATGLYAWCHSNIGYMATGCALSWVCASLFKETHGREPTGALVVSSRCPESAAHDSGARQEPFGIATRLTAPQVRQ
jgi:MFS family permease